MPETPCTCSTSRAVQVLGEPSSHNQHGTHLHSHHSSLIGAKEGAYEHVGTFHYYQQQDQHHQQHRLHRHHRHGSGEDCVTECDEVCQKDACNNTNNSSRHGQAVVAAEAISDAEMMSRSETFPAATLLVEAAFLEDVPALSLSLLELKPPTEGAKARFSHHEADSDDDTSDDDGLSASVPVVYANPVEAVAVVPTTAPCMYEGASGTDCWNRPQFLSATVVRESKDQKFGIKFQCDSHASSSNGSSSNRRLFGRRLSKNKKEPQHNEFPRISKIHKHSNGLLSQAPFCVGDQLISINKESCRGVAPTVFAARLADLSGVVTFVVQHPGGDASLAESFLRKPTPESKTGIGLVYSRRQNRLRVKSVHYAGLMVEGLLQVEDRIVAINHVPCQHWDAKTAADQIALSPLWVSIVARRHRDAAVVLTVSEGAEPPADLIGTGTLTGAFASLMENFDSTCSNDYITTGRRRCRLLPRRR